MKKAPRSFPWGLTDGDRLGGCGSLRSSTLPLLLTAFALLASVVPRLLRVVIPVLPTPVDQKLLDSGSIRLRRQQIRVSGHRIPRKQVWCDGVPHQRTPQLASIDPTPDAGVSTTRANMAAT